MVLLRDDPCSFGFGLSSAEDAIVLVDAHGRLADSAAWRGVGEDASWARLPDGDGAFGVREGTLGGPNQATEDLHALDEDDAHGAHAKTCAAYNGTEFVGHVKSAELGEASGVVQSRMNADVLWIHVDGFYPRLYAVSSSVADQGAVLAEVQLPFTGFDFEDVALGGCPHIPHTSCIFLGDIGDNCARRDEDGSSSALSDDPSCTPKPFHTIYAFPEPNVTLAEAPDGSVDAVAVIAVRRKDVMAWNFMYPFGAMDSESLFVSPDGSRFWVIEKKSGDDDVRVVSNVAGYELGDFRSGDFVPVNPVVSIKNPGKGAAITGADLHPSGKRLLLVTAHKGTFEHALGIPFEPASLSKHANLIAGPQDHFYQYEGVAYEAVRNGVWQVSEMPDGYQPIEYTHCVRLDDGNLQGENGGEDDGLGDGLGDENEKGKGKGKGKGKEGGAE